MKVNQLGTLAIVGVLVSLTAACGGSPTRPTAANPALGGGTSATSVKLTTFQQDVAVDQICTAQSVTYDDAGNLIPDVSTTTDTPAMTCVPAPPADPPHDDAVVSDSTSMDSVRFVRSLNR